jgi:polyribonucleotide nucleotidyltransferase
MIEAEANEVPKDVLKEAFEIGQKAIDASCEFQAKFLKTIKPKIKEIAYNKPSEELIAYITNILTKDKLQALT